MSLVPGPLDTPQAAGGNVPEAEKEKARRRTAGAASF